MRQTSTSRMAQQQQQQQRLSLLLLWAILTLSAMKVCHAAAPTQPVICDKHIYVLAGPRRSATTSVADFFYQYARGPQPHREHGKTYHPLSKFRWPLVYGVASNETEKEMPYKRFNHLVTDYDNEALRTEILEAIERDYNIDTVNSVIFGGEEFEQVGFYAEKGYDAIRAVKAVQEITGAPKECVTIIFNYRAKRFEHWVSLYGNGMLENPDDPKSKESLMPYNEHMCVDDSTEDRLQELGTSMNPMYLAEMYLNEGWNVKMIDMAGVENEGTDISHTIACHVMGGVCDDDGKWVLNHNEEVFLNKYLKYEFKHLSKEETDLSEKLFRYRDCAYEEDLRGHPRFEIIFDDEIWSDCLHDEDHEWIYQSFRDPKKGNKLFFDALLSQVDCQEYGGVRSSLDESKSEVLETAEIDEFLDGTYQKKHATSLMGELRNEFTGKSFSVPLILVVVLFAIGAGYFMGKMRDESGYRLPGIEMAGGLSGRSGGRSGPRHTSLSSASGGFGSKISNRREVFSDERNDDGDSSSSGSDDSDDEQDFI